MDPIAQEANNSDANNSSVRVEIFNQTYSLRGTDPDYILELAEYVDSVMRAVAEQTHTVDGARLAVLTALNIAEEYHLLKTKLEAFSEEARQRTRERRQRHYTKRNYEQELLAIVNDESVPAKERHEALFALGRSRGYQRRPPAKR